jgi:hypothetical protein
MSPSKNLDKDKDISIDKEIKRRGRSRSNDQSSSNVKKALDHSTLEILKNMSSKKVNERSTSKNKPINTNNNTNTNNNSNSNYNSIDINHNNQQIVKDKELTCNENLNSNFVDTS